MNDEITYRREDQIIYIVGNGDYSFSSLYEIIGEIIQEAETLENISILYDARGATAERNNTEVRQFVSDIASHWPGKIHCLATVVSNENSYNLARLGSLYAKVKGCKAECFHDIKSAKQWIAEIIKISPNAAAS